MNSVNDRIYRENKAFYRKTLKKREDLMMEKTQIKARIAALQAVMREQNVDFYLVPTADFHHSEYVNDYFKMREFLSGFTGSNGTLVVSAKEAGLWTDGRYFIQAEQELSGTGITLFRMQEEGVPDICEYLEQEGKQGEVVCFDGRVIDAAFGKKLEKRLGHKGMTLSYGTDLADAIWEERPALPANPVQVLPEELCGATVEEKLTQVRRVLREKECEYLFLAKLDDLMWLMNIRGKDVECNPVVLSYGFVTRNELFYFVQGEAVTDEFRAYAKKHQITLKEYDELAAFLSSFSYEGAVMADEKNLSYLLYKLIGDRTRLVNGANPTELLKAVKNPVELENMRKVYLKDSVAVTKFIYWLKNRIGKEPITELSAAEYLDGLRAEIPGFLDLSFPTISAYKENAAMMHYEATQEQHKTLDAEAMLLVDSGGQYLGGTTDVTRTIVLGPISEEIRRHYSAVAAGMLQMTAANFLYGCTGRNVDILARQPLWDMNIDYKCGTGHGIGYILNVHEGPQGIRWRFTEGMTEAVLEPGMIVTNEPGVYIEGSHGILIENVIVVQKGVKNGDGQFLKFETLTFVPLDRLALDVSYLRAEDVARIDAYHKEVYEKVAPFLTEEEKEWLFKETRPLSKNPC